MTQIHRAKPHLAISFQLLTLNWSGVCRLCSNLSFLPSFGLQALSSSSSITTRAAACTGCGLWGSGISWTSQWVRCEGYFWWQSFQPLEALSHLRHNVGENVSVCVCVEVRNGDSCWDQHWGAQMLGVVVACRTAANVPLSEFRQQRCILCHVVPRSLLLFHVPAEGFQSWMWRGLTFLLPILFFGHVSPHLTHFVCFMFGNHVSSQVHSALACVCCPKCVLKEDAHIICGESRGSRRHWEREHVPLSFAVLAAVQLGDPVSSGRTRGL